MRFKPLSISSNTPLISSKSSGAAAFGVPGLVIGTSQQQNQVYNYWQWSTTTKVERGAKNMARPWKYDILIEALEDDVLYHTAGIIKHCDQQGLFDYSFDYEGKKLSPQEKEHAMKKARSSLSTFASKYLSKPDGYNEANRPSKALYPAFLGGNWKNALVNAKQKTSEALKERG